MSCKSIRFTIPGKPQGKDRPRMTKTGHVYTTKKTADYEKLIKQCCTTSCPDRQPEYEKSVAVNIWCEYGIPKGMPKKMAESAFSGKIQPCKKPDADNIAKVVCDALNGIAYKDDKQIVNLSVTKMYSEKPCVVVTVVYMDS